MNSLKTIAVFLVVAWGCFAVSVSAQLPNTDTLTKPFTDTADSVRNTGTQFTDLADGIKDPGDGIDFLQGGTIDWKSTGANNPWGAEDLSKNPAPPALNNPRDIVSAAVPELDLKAAQGESFFVTPRIYDNSTKNKKNEAQETNALVLPGAMRGMEETFDADISARQVAKIASRGMVEAAALGYSEPLLLQTANSLSTNSFLWDMRDMTSDLSLDARVSKSPELMGVLRMFRDCIAKRTKKSKSAGGGPGGQKQAYRDCQYDLGGTLEGGFEMLKESLVEVLLRLEEEQFEAAEKRKDDKPAINLGMFDEDEFLNFNPKNIQKRKLGLAAYFRLHIGDAQFISAEKDKEKIDRSDPGAAVREVISVRTLPPQGQNISEFLRDTQLPKVYRGLLDILRARCKYEFEDTPIDTTPSQSTIENATSENADEAIVTQFYDSTFWHNKSRVTDEMLKNLSVEGFPFNENFGEKLYRIMRQRGDKPVCDDFSESKPAYSLTNFTDPKKRNLGKIYQNVLYAVAVRIARGQILDTLVEIQSFIVGTKILGDARDVGSVTALALRMLDDAVGSEAGGVRFVRSENVQRLITIHEGIAKEAYNSIGQRGSAITQANQPTGENSTNPLSGIGGAR